ncbi:3'-5' exonuclease [Geitlerinema sp. PCC 9228]|uniref:3'-5' exonuclease n=1 Tax=Geitlerinema sp. PCC 9228 TaxID=111611 RepID=UPI0008F9C303|nr:3'-5' exonuclease [Geitlerinema sp. PCC 9228]
MASWTVSVTDTFLNELLNLPHKVSKRIQKTVKTLEKDPISARGDAKKLKNYQNNVYRVRIGDYRLFYTFGNGWVKLLSVRPRSDRTYNTELPDTTVPETSPEPLASNITETPASNITETPAQTTSFPTSSQGEPLPMELTTECLQRWQIPQEYWETIQQVTNADELLELSIPERYTARILDNLFPRPIEQIETQPEYRLPYPEDLERFFEGDLSAFLLKLDPEQEKVLDFGREGPILVKGGPGTGKSTLAIYRVQKLLELGYRPLLFTTYTNALVTYSRQLLEQLLGRSLEAAGVTVTTVDSLTYQYHVRRWRKPKFIKQPQAWEYLEAALETTAIPAKNAFDRQVRRQNLQQLGAAYLLSEFEDVIEAWGLTTCQAYLDFDRRGRGMPLKSSIREAIWAVYETWRDRLAADGLLSWGQLRQNALDVAQQNEPPYRGLVVDEAQDLTPVALRFLLSLVPDFRGVYLTADASQSIYHRGFSWKQVHAHLKVTGRTISLKRNHRNTRQILDASQLILAGTNAGNSESDQEPLAVSEAEAPAVSEAEAPSSHQGDPPTLLLTDDRDRQIDFIRDFLVTAAKTYRLPLHGGAVLCPDNQTAKAIAKQLSHLGLAAKHVSSREIDLEASHIKVLTLHSAKGLEFPFVAVVGLEAGQLPHLDEDLPGSEEETVLNEQRRLLFVGCTRAMRALMVSGSHQHPSPFVRSLKAPFWHQQVL